MDTNSKAATKVLAAIAESNSSTMVMVRRLEAMTEVENVSFDFECSKNQAYLEFGVSSPYLFNWYVDVSLKNGNSILWKLDVSWDESNWIIEASVELPGEYGPNTLREFPDRVAETIDEFVVQLAGATSELLESANLIQSQI